MDLYKTFWRRVAALIIDALVMAPLTGLTLFMMWRGTSFSAYLLLTVLGTLVGCLYWIGMHGRYGQTLGKMAAGIKVFKMDDEPICYGVATMRYLPFIVIGILMTIPMLSYLSDLNQITFQSMTNAPKWGNWINWVWLIAQLITVLSNPMRRAIHDFIAGTKVMIVKKEVSSLIERPPAAS
jgi:uncharacterized RDD family membrane protein YckC